MARKINHCGKNIPVENRYAVSNFPNHGDTTYFDAAKCQRCGHNVHDYWHYGLRATKPTPIYQTDKYDRHKYDELIRSGQAFIIPSHQDEIPRNTRAQVLACEWTLQTIKPADQTAYYIRKNDEAPWISNKSILIIEEQRERWVAQLARLRARRDKVS
jgi:hypothetical protein